MIKLLNGYVCDPATGFTGYADITIDNGIITAIDTDDNMSKEQSFSESVINATGLVIAPGFCDTHVHFRDPGLEYKEDINTGAACAKKGGFTDVIMMANTKPVIDNVQTLKYVLEKGKKTGINVHACATVTKGMKGKELTDMDALLKEGAIGFTDDGVPIMDKDILKEAFEKCATLNVPICLHEEDKRIIKENGINHGAASDYFDVYGSPREAEIKLIERDLKIAEGTGVKLDIQHISARESVELVKKAKAKGIDVYAEVTPHHLFLTEEAMIANESNAKMNPPLRTKKDQAALREGIKNGTLTIIATDHAPHSKEEKDMPVTEAPSGIIGLETAFSLAYKELVPGGDRSYLMNLLKLFTVNPRKLFNLPSEGIRVGAPADLVLFNDKENWKYEESLSKAVNTPFFGYTLPCKIMYTICNGEIVYKA